MPAPKAATSGRNVSLNAHMNRFVDEQVASGRHQSASEVVSEALRRYEADIAAELAGLEMIRRIAREGQELLGRGEVTVVEGHSDTAALFRRVSGRDLPWTDPARRG